ncbi:MULTISPECIES: methylated-DNA--[protein]-cysteine S-methyltransferase [unclassified Desulfovibrio]|uniref:methylated-DNA--[protein]-cysteine S-methyltransferase n=1 Tax=unclassified Desulfovibrio TaxID=2593640 RepID=UPI000F60440A|nr:MULTISPECIES: methylated-DNA--[protein]-cysteine S-methyltransferase [unclassified Desulfovibrio]RRD70934.1 methylated-DNA--[protein]-cysteine S-methyltransferase [Desulfovibrio sp. OH1209_COT-279]RRD87307.1 methylated-DNA--[protein]-cysteine S-methyltransferase [Desulfovibrio sp. OH1186_COT-070]
MLLSTEYASPLGAITLVSHGSSLAGLWFEGEKYFAPATGSTREGHGVLDQAKKWLDAYFAGKKPSIADIPLAPQGSAFRQAVWNILRHIPYGQCTTYGEIARQMGAHTGKKMAAQAVGGAVGHNPVSIIIPCHRVVGAGGNLTGYGGGIARKMRLLELEGVDMSGFFIPRKGTAL